MREMTVFKEDDPLPAIERLQIKGEAFPGQQITACGISINGTTTCTFEWVRHLEDGSVHYIEGANQPTYLVTADDVDTYLAIKILPIDYRKRKGDLVTLFANDQNKIICDAEMHEEIEKTILVGRATYQVSLPTGFLDFWESASLTIKREGFSIKSHGTADVDVTEKFSSTLAVTIPFGQPTEFVIHSCSGRQQILRIEQNGQFRDTIVLIIRFFIKVAHNENSTCMSCLVPLLTEYGLQPLVWDAQNIVSNLKVAHNEKTTCMSFLVSLFTEYWLQSSVWKAQNIVSNIKVLFKHLQEKLSFSEAKLKKFQIPLKTLWLPLADDSDFIQSPFHPNKNTPHIVPQQSHPQGQSLTPIQAKPIWKTPETNDNPFVGDMTPEAAVENNSPPNRLSGTEMYGDDKVEACSVNEGLITEESNQLNLGLVTVHGGPDSLSPEEDDPLPAIEGLQIEGEAFPGQQIMACGISINGTTTCTFEWVRHLEDGSVHYIEGANRPTYLVTADDVDTYLAVKIQPLDYRKRKGDLVTLFANDQNKITCDAEMREEIEKTNLAGHATYQVSLAIGFLDFWEPATLMIKREGFSIKSHGTADVNITEKFSSILAVTIPFGQPTEFVIHSSSGRQQILRIEQNGQSRDTIVLLLRFFIEVRERKRKGGFFK